MSVDPSEVPREGVGPHGHVSVSIPAWSQAKEDRLQASLVESVWTNWASAVASIAAACSGIAALGFLIRSWWSATWGQYNPLVIGLCVVVAVVWLYRTSPLWLALPTPPAPHGPFTVANSLPPGCEIQVKRVYLIVNPVSGGGRGKILVKDTIIPAFKAAGVTVDVQLTRRAGDAHELARTLPITGPDGPFDAFVLVGGDGTIHEVTNGMMSRADGKKLPIGVIPGGTGNSMMMDFMADDHRLVRSPEDAVAAITGGVAPWIDLNKVIYGPHPVKQTCYSTNLVGFSSDQCTQAVNIEDWNAILGAARYDVCALWGLLKGRRADVTLVLDDKVVSTKLSTLFINHTQHIGKGLRGAPMAVWDDGCLDVIGMEHETLSQQLRIFNGVKAKGAHYSFVPVMQQGKKVTLQFRSDEGLFNVDGQVARFEGGKIEIECIHRAIQFFAPRSALCT